MGRGSGHRAEDVAALLLAFGVAVAAGIISALIVRDFLRGVPPKRIPRRH